MNRPSGRPDEAAAAVGIRVPATALAPAMFLRPWEEGDIAQLIEVYRDPVLRRRTRIPVTGVEDAVQWLELQDQGWASGERLSFAALEDGRLVANVVIKSTGTDGLRGEVGYWTAAGARGRGVAPRALEALTVWAFENLAGGRLEGLDLLHQVDNAASCRVAEKTGYAYETTLPARPPFPRDGHLHTRRARG